MSTIESWPTADRYQEISASRQDAQIGAPSVLCIGGEDHALRIPFLLALRDKGIQITAAGSGDPAPFIRAGIPYKKISLARFVNPLADWFTLKQLRQFLMSERPSIVQCFDTKLNVLVPFAARGISGIETVSTINGLGWMYSSRTPLALALRPIYQTLQRWAERFTALTIFQNRDDQTFFERHNMLRADQGRLVPGSGVDMVRFDADFAATRSVTELRKEFQLGGAPVVITISRITRQKGIPTFLRAANIVHRQWPEVRFLLIGPSVNEGSAALKQSEIDKHSPYVRAVGVRKDIPALLALADVFVCPTELREGVPRVLLEAAAAARPIVATAMPGCTDVINDGRNGRLVPPHRPDVMAARIIELLRNREQAAIFGRRAAERARKEFSLGVTVARYASIYHEVLYGLAPSLKSEGAETFSNSFDCGGAGASRLSEIANDMTTYRS